MSLKTNYKNDKYSGQRKYLVITNPDNTVSFDDKTQYEENGDIFSAEDINDTNKEIINNAHNIAELNNELVNFSEYVGLKFDKLTSVKYAKFLASSWSDSEPYMQTVNVQGITAQDKPIAGIDYSDNPAASVVEERERVSGYIYRLVTGDGTVTLYCHKIKPDIDFSIRIKGV